MNFLFQHIEYLLLRHDCVIVPGLGAFIAIYESARYLEDSQIITPPVRNVMFNQAVVSDDGLLANSIARKAGISFEDASQALVRCVASLKKSLSENQTVKAGNLGVLALTDEGRLLFTPVADNNRHMGLEPVTLFNKRPVMIPDHLQESDHNEEYSRKYYEFRISKAFLRVSAAVLVVFAVALTVILNPLPNDNLRQKASVIPVDAIIPVAAEKHQKSDTINPIIAKDKDTDSGVTQQELPMHYLIVATFTNEEEAVRYADKKSTDEYPLSAVASRKLTRVYAASSTDREELRKKLNSSEFSSRFPNSWIWTRQ